MALSADDYFTPLGELSKAQLWPRLDGETESTRDSRAEDDVTAWLTIAYTKTSDDDLTRLYVYGRAWLQFADGLNSVPATAQNVEGGRTWTQEQISYWSLKATAALTEFEGGVAEDAGEFGVITSYR